MATDSTKKPWSWAKHQLSGGNSEPFSPHICDASLIILATCPVLHVALSILPPDNFFINALLKSLLKIQILLVLHHLPWASLAGSFLYLWIMVVSSPTQNNGVGDSLIIPANPATVGKFHYSCTNAYNRKWGTEILPPGATHFTNLMQLSLQRISPIEEC